MSELDEYTRWDKTHALSIHIDYMEYVPEVVKNERDYFALDVIICNPILADLFGVTVDKEKNRLDQAVLDAIQMGDHIFYLEFGDHSMYWCRLRDQWVPSGWNSGCAGAIIVRKDAWHKAVPGRTFARSYVSKLLHQAFDRWMDAELNGWLFEAFIHDHVNDECFCIGPFLSPEEALTSTMNAYPDICYKPDDFNPEFVYRLKNDSQQ